MKSISRNLLIGVAVITIINLISTPAQAAERPINAKCFLKIDNVIYMNGKCNFEGEGTSDHFSDLKLLIACRDGQASCSTAEQRIKRPGVFGYLVRESNTASLCWNESKLLKATPCYQGLRRNGACWSNPRAKGNFNSLKPRDIEFCAWAL